MSQLPLFEPSGPEVLPLCEAQFKLADLYARRAEVVEVRGWSALAAIARRAAADHERAAIELAMLAEFERLAGIVQ